MQPSRAFLFIGKESYTIGAMTTDGQIIGVVIGIILLGVIFFVAKAKW